MISLKLSSPKCQERITLSGDTSFGDFLETVSRKTSIPISQCRISTGFPPEVVFGEAGDKLSTFTPLSSGSVVLVREGEPSSLKMSRDVVSVVSVGLQQLMSMGYSISVAEQALGIAGNDMTLALEIAEGIIAETSMQTEISGTVQATSAIIEEKRVLTRRIIDADNSCLFNAIGFLIHKDKHKMGSQYRQVIVDEIRSNEEMYSADILGQSTEDYVKWILNPEKWGGEIEMNILSKYLKVEIAAVDIQTGKSYIYGENSNLTSRIYLLYDGIHYDAITLAKVSTTTESTEDSDVTIFSPTDTTIADQTEIMASELRKKKLFVNMAGCDLQCLVCLKGLKGQADAQAHAKSTGHQNFGQIDV